jgi:hypothetical protein
MSRPETPPIDTFGRVPEYVAMLETARQKGVCLLDIDVFMETQADSILSRVGGWVLAKSLHPYSNTARASEGIVGHSLIFPERHIVSPADMTSEDVLTQWQLLNECAEIHGAKTGAFFMRFSFDGNFTGSGATIEHIHSHVIAPHLDPETGRVPGANTPQTKQVKLWVG